jgi:polyribonucleotide nucleotidyltransferase
MFHTVEVDLDGRKITLETGKMAKQANGAVVVRSGDSVVLVTACMANDPKPGAGFFPLTVDYREYTYAAGKIPGGFIKREGRPSEKEVLTSRLIDRPVRPLFPEGFLYETQIIAMVLSADPEQDPNSLAIVGAAAALAISDIPFPHVLSGVRVSMKDGQYLANATYTEGRESKLNIIVAGTEDGIVMVEAGAQQVSEAEVLGAIEFGHQCCKKIVAGIRELMKLAGKPKREFAAPALDQTLYDQISKDVRAELTDALNTEKHDKAESHTLVAALKKRVVEAQPEEQQAEAVKCLEALRERIFRDEMIENHRRPDGRAFDEIRPITIETGALPRTHGSALFTRGETQALVTITLGTKDDEQRIELIEPGESPSKRFMLHYNFPPFSVGETGFMRGPGRREIGHGALAERALAALIPTEETFPYTMRVVSDILESNGSSSQATVCGASLALMDAGVPLAAHVGGIAMGLVMEGKDYAILTDIAGAEDHYGDMDFKVAGTREGITALQMDIKIPNVTTAIMKEALEQARHGRLFILGKMYEALPKANAAISPVRAAHLHPAYSDRQDPRRDWTRRQSHPRDHRADRRQDRRRRRWHGSRGSRPTRLRPTRRSRSSSDLTASAEVGKTYLGKVVRLVDFGAFVEIFPGTDGLLHISEIAENRIRDVRDELKEGDQILVKVLALEGNKIKLSRKAVLKEQREKLKHTKQ